MGSLRFRKSIRLGAGVRLNVSKRGIGLSAGPRGARVSIHSSGRRTATVGVPGTGIAYQSSIGGKRGRGAGDEPGRASTPTPALAAAKKPGLLAPAYEKRFAKGVVAYADGNAGGALRLFEEAAGADAKDRSSSDDLMFGFMLLGVGRGGEAIAPLERVVASEHEMPDRLMCDYAPGLSFTTTIGGFLAVHLPIDSATAAIMLALAYRQLERHEDAIGVLQQLHLLDPADPLVVFLLATSCIAAEDLEEAVETTGGVTNDDDLTCLSVLARAEALQGLHLLDAAWDAAKATTARKRSPAILKRGYYRRGEVLSAQGKPTAARKEYERAYAIDPGYEDVRQKLGIG